MADVSGRTRSNEPSPSDEVSGSKNRILSSGSANRFKSRLSKSPKRRAGTPEPEQRTYTDESEKDISDGEGLTKAEEKRHNSGIRRFFSRKGKQDTRSKSLEPKGKEPESEDDFETILRMHKTKEAEEEMKANEKPKPKVKEELKEFIPKEMPPLILAPKDNKKRKRHKSLPCQESQSEEEKPKTPVVKMKTRRKPSTSEEEELAGSRRGSEDLRNRKSVNRRILKKMEKEPESERVSDDKEVREEKEEEKKKEGFFGRWFKGKKVEEPKAEKAQVKEKDKEKTPKSWLVVDVFREWHAHVAEHRHYYNSCLCLKNRCITNLIILLMLCGCGGIVFRFTEGAFESFYKCGVKRVKRDFIDTLWKSSQYMLEEDWKSQARRKLMEFENQLHSAHEAGMTTYSGQKSWSFLNSVVFCLSVVTTIGYGHISPSTTTGRAITIIYAIFGIPMFLILLADFGKLFTRGIKFLWAFVRRLYYTGSCRRVRKTAPVQEMMKGVQIMYDFAKSRRLTTAGLEPQQQQHLRHPDGNLQGMPETPSTPNWSAFEIDDEFNLPISVAISILLVYIFFGAFLYWIWEEWSFFESFYFVFISMSTIGFGDFVPQHPMYMMLSIVYLIFGLALTSMCINVVQEKLSDTFRQASAKLGTTIGLSVIEEAGIIPPQGITQEPNNQSQ